MSFHVVIRYDIVGIFVPAQEIHFISSNKVRSMPLVNFSNVDFDQIKESIKDYLRSNSNFTDYDFEGSNLTTIIDTLITPTSTHITPTW